MRSRTSHFSTTMAGMVTISAVFIFSAFASLHADDSKASSDSKEVSGEVEHASAIFAGGCFWCVESDFEHAPGVVNVISGYSGGRNSQPTYDNYASGGHREVVFVMYDPKQVTYAGLVEYLIKHIDPTDRRGQFNDKGLQYSPAIYFENDEEKEAAERVIQALDGMKAYYGKINVAVEPRAPFWPAEEYHQNYHQKNALQYSFYRMRSGRDAFVNRSWGTRASVLELPGAYPNGKVDAAMRFVSMDEDPDKKAKPWLTFKKPSPLELKRQLNATQYKVTQQEGTETAFRNAYWDNKRDGIYVDVVSGAPLFSSKDKFKSGTGWPSFVAPISEDALTFRVDKKLFYTRTEVRSRYGDSHLGHVFDDGPVDRGGKRYCMNSAAMRFIPKEKMEEEGYGEFLKLFDADAPSLSK